MAENEKADSPDNNFPYPDSFREYKDGLLMGTATPTSLRAAHDPTQPYNVQVKREPIDEDDYLKATQEVPVVPVPILAFPVSEPALLVEVVASVPDPTPAPVVTLPVLPKIIPSKANYVLYGVIMFLSALVSGGSTTLLLRRQHTAVVVTSSVLEVERSSFGEKDGYPLSPHPLADTSETKKVLGQFLKRCRQRFFRRQERQACLKEAARQVGAELKKSTSMSCKNLVVTGVHPADALSACRRLKKKVYR